MYLLHLLQMVANMLRNYIVFTSKGIINLIALNQTAAVISTLELTGPGSRVLRCVQQGDW